MHWGPEPDLSVTPRLSPCKWQMQDRAALADQGAIDNPACGYTGGSHLPVLAN